MLKCFVFFLISQPVVYIVEIIFGNLDLNRALIYYTSYWLKMTIAVLPGAFIAFYCKKQNILGAIILGLGNTIQLVMAVMYAVKCIGDFPHHILSFIVCIASIFIMSFTIQKEKKNRLIALIVPVVLAAVLAVLAALTGRLHF